MFCQQTHTCRLLRAGKDYRQGKFRRGKNGHPPRNKIQGRRRCGNLSVANAKSVILLLISSKIDMRTVIPSVFRPRHFIARSAIAPA